MPGAFDEWPRPLRPGQRPRAGELNALARAAVETDQVSGTGDAGTSRELGGVQVRDYAQPGHWARITAAGTGAYYPHVAVWLKNGTWTDLPSPPYVTGQTGRRWAREANGNTAVPANAIVYLVPEPGTEGFSFTYGGAGGGTWAVPIALISAALPTGCDGLGRTTDQCWGPYYFALLVAWDAACGAWVTGGCVFLLSVSGQKLVLGKRYPSGVLGDPPANIKGAPVPLDFPCSNMTAAPLYGTASRETRTIYVGNPYAKCLTPGTLGYLQFYEATEEVWGDCNTRTVIGTGYVADVNGCSLTPGTRVDGQFERMLLGSEVGGNARECVPLYTVKREKNQQVDLRCEGNNLNLYAPSALDPCGDTLVYSKTVACCDPNCSGGGGGGSGGTATCCGRKLASTLPVSVAGNGVFNITWDGSTYWQGSALLACGETLELRMGLDCLVDYRCPGGTWVPAAAAIGSPTCSPKFISVRWTVNMDDTGTPGCVSGKCGSLDLYIQEP